MGAVKAILVLSDAHIVESILNLPRFFGRLLAALFAMLSCQAMILRQHGLRLLLRFIATEDCQPVDQNRISAMNWTNLMVADQVQIQSMEQVVNASWLNYADKYDLDPELVGSVSNRIAPSGLG